MTNNQFEKLQEDAPVQKNEHPANGGQKQSEVDNPPQPGQVTPEVTVTASRTIKVGS